ncbi:hypothetical protein CCP2SC5_170045 [Azospirillaceae bacterium]
MGRDSAILLKNHARVSPVSRFHNRFSASPFSFSASSRIAPVVLLLLLALVGATFVFLATWDMPAPSKTVEKVVPDSRFQR